MPLRTKLRKFKPVAVLLGLSLLWAFDALRTDALPSLFRSTAEASYFLQSAVLWSVLAVGATIPVVIRRNWPSRRQALHVALISLGIFVVPVLLTHATAHEVTDQTRVLLFMLTPLFAAVFEPFFGTTDTRQPGGSMVAVLVAVAGALLLFSLHLPGSIQEGGWFGLLILAAVCLAAVNCWAVRVTQCDGTVSVFASAAIGAGTAALVFAGLGIVIEPHSLAFQRLWPNALWSLVVDLPALLAFFWLLSNMSATRMTLRFILAPLLTLLLSIVLFRPAVSPQTAAGLALMATGAGWILFVAEFDDAAQPSLLQSRDEEGD